MVGRDNPFHKAVDLHQLPSMLGSEMKPAPLDKVRTIGVMPEFYRNNGGWMPNCEHALVWRRYLLLFSTGLRLPSAGSELLCKDGQCHSPEEKRKSTTDDPLWSYKQYPAFWQWADSQAEHHEGYNYFEGVEDCWGWDEEEEDWVRSERHPVQRDLGACSCKTGIEPTRRGDLRHKDCRDEFRRWEEDLAWWQAEAEAASSPVQADDDCTS